MKKLITINLLKESRLEKKYEQIKAIYQNNSYLFKIDNIKTILNKKIFTREDNNYKFVLDIENKQATYFLKENNLLFDIDVEKVIYKEENNSIILEYKLASNDEIIRVEIIIEGDLNE